jgi:hypothetical protein
MSSLSFITIVSFALLNILWLLSFVKIHPKINSSGSKNGLPKLSIPAALGLAVCTDVKTVVFICNSFLPIYPPVVDSK